MNAPGRTFYLTIGGIIAAMILGALVNDDNILVPAVVMVLALSLALYRVFWRGILLEAVVLGGLLFGYIVGESGFGHLHVSESVFFGEVGLVACFLIFSIRVAFTKERFIHRDPLSLVICAFVLNGFLRYLADVWTFSGSTKDLLTATRDFATIYYAAFYFITFNIFKHERSRRFLEGVFPVAIPFLFPIAVATLIDPGIWETLSYHEQALIAARWDLAESFLGFGALYFMLSREGRGHWILRTLVGFLCFAFMMAGNSRAPVVGFGLSILLLLHARKIRVVREYVIFGILGLCALAAISVLKPATGEENLTSLFSDKILSIVDISSVGNYETDYGSGKAGNNHFRTEWWKSVYRETMEQNPWVGLGFGYDLAARFLRVYDAPIAAEEFSARSPHSILFTIFGRMGFFGLASFLFVISFMFRGALRCALAVRRKQAPATDLASWCGAVIIFVASCFSVMLEGPMAAITFWSLLGMASYRQMLTTEASEETRSPKPLPGNRPASRPPLVAAGYR